VLHKHPRAHVWGRGAGRQDRGPAVG
jgi:hypothetical protein